jgi:NAD-dependent deacetylase
MGLSESSGRNYEQAARILLNSRYVIALTGAGLSVESGIPPFRGPGGLWTKYGEPPMNAYQLFLENPKKAWEERLDPKGPLHELGVSLARAKPNPAHLALAGLERSGILKCLITQNVDHLHRLAGSNRLIEIHGNYTLVRCLHCGSRYPYEGISLESLPPSCPQCDGVLKWDTVSFGEPIPREDLDGCYRESEKADCMIVAGTSASVYPAAEFPRLIRERGGRLIELNLMEGEITPLSDVSLRGSAGETFTKLLEAVRGRGN